MKARLILLDTPIIVSDEIAGFTYNKPTWNISGKIGFPENNQSRKIIAGLPDLPSIDFSLLSEADCKKIEWVDVEKLARERYPIAEFHPATRYLGDGFIEGFQKAQSLNEKKYSLEDMRKLASAAFTIKSNNETLIEDFDKWFDNRIKSLSRRKVFDIEIEMECVEERQCNCIDNSQCSNSIKVTKIL